MDMRAYYFSTLFTEAAALAFSCHTSDSSVLPIQAGSSYCIEALIAKNISKL